MARPWLVRPEVRGALVLAALLLAVTARAAGELPVPGRSLSDWLTRLHQASQNRSFAGNFVVSSGTGVLASSRIWHACDGVQQVERVDSLTGAPRSTLRRNDEVLTLFPAVKLARYERQDSIAQFPRLVQEGDFAIASHYAVRELGTARAAGFDADVVQFQPRDALRFGYRIWSERRTGLILQLQTLDAEGRVLEQAAFSELSLDVPLRPEHLAAAMVRPQGWRVERAIRTPTTAGEQGWALRGEVPGFRSIGCHRETFGPLGQGVLQWTFSDGLASVSLFIEPFDATRHRAESMGVFGATHTLTRRIREWWLTAMGEVPPSTLRLFAQGLERKP